MAQSKKTWRHSFSDAGGFPPPFWRGEDWLGREDPKVDEEKKEEVRAEKEEERDEEVELVASDPRLWGIMAMALRDQSEVSEKKKNQEYIRLTLSNDLMLFWTFGDLPSCLVQRLVPLGRVFHLKSSKVQEEAKSLLWHTVEFCCILSLDIP